MATMFTLKKGVPIIALALVGVMIPTARASAQDAKRGQEVYAAQKCQGCHNIAGKGYKANTLDGVGKKLSAEEIHSWIVMPKAMATKAGSKAKKSSSVPPFSPEKTRTRTAPPSPAFGFPAARVRLG